MSEQKYTTVSIPKPLYDKIKKAIEGTGFTSVSDYVVFVLREVLSAESIGKGVGKDEEEIVREKLKSLGYFE